MTNPRRVLLCTFLVVLAGCNGVPGGLGSSTDAGTDTAPPTDETVTPTETATPTGDGVVGEGARANFTGGNFSASRLRSAHRAYFDRAESVTVVSRTTFESAESSNGSSNATFGEQRNVVTVVRVGENGTLFSQPVPDDATVLSAAAQNDTDTPSLSRIADYRNASGSGTYVNASGAAFVRERVFGTVTHEFHPAGSTLANFSTPDNVTSMGFATLANMSLDYHGMGTRDEFAGHVYSADDPSALQIRAIDQSNVTTFSFTAVVAPEGYVRYLEMTLGVQTETGNATFRLQKAVTKINETTVPKPDWLGIAREDDQVEEFNFSDSNETTSLGSKYANDTSVLDDGRVTLNVTMERETFEPLVRIEETNRFDNPNLNEWRVGSVARYSYTAERAEEVQITIHYEDSQVPGPESNITAAVWDREDQFFYPLNATVDTEANTVTITLTGDEVEEYQRRAILAMDYERYLAFFEGD